MSEEKPIKIFDKIEKDKLFSLLAVAIFFVFSLIMTFPLIFHMSDHIPDSLGDPYYNIWAMSWNQHAIFSSDHPGGLLLASS
ncbi:MAG: hypothetical protein H8E54_06125 [Candidatus Aminicenantes bacterium]|nr:hypothetical protein [Candidatus Aminicenantes bacterium]